MTDRPKIPRWKSWLQNLALSASVFFLCVVGFELILRLNNYGNLEIYEPDPVLYWKLKPNQDCYTKIGRKPVHINSRGTRGVEFAVPKPANTVRILSLGDSRTFGWGLSEGETYSHRLQGLLGAKLGPDRKVEVINAGVNAWSFPQMLAYFRTEGLDYQPNIVILAEANLWTQFSERNSSEFVRKFMRRVWLKNFLRRFATYHYVVEVKLKGFYEKHRTKFIPVAPNEDPFFKEQQRSNPDEMFRSTIEDFCRLALTNGVQPVLLYLPIADDLGKTNLPAIQQTKRKVSESLGIPLVEFSPPSDKAQALYLEGDSVHFNPQGNELIATQLFDSVQKMTRH